MAKKYHELTSEEKKKGWITLIVMVFLIIFYLKCCSNDEKPVEVNKTEVVLNPAQKSKKHNIIEAYAIAATLIQKQLKAPSTAEFAYNIDDVVQKNDSTFFIKSYVDSENSFGAKIRADYVCTITYTSDDVAHLDIIDFKQR